MNKRTKDRLLATLAIVAVAASIYFSFGTRSQKINLSTYEILGTVTAEETAKLVGNQGRVLVMARDTGEDPIPSVVAELEAFGKTLKKHPGMSVVIEKVVVPPMMMMATGGGVPPDQFLKALDVHAPLAAVVLFFGFPQLSDSELDTLKQHNVKTVVVASFRPDFKRLLDQQAIHLAIVPRPDAPEPGTATSGSVRARFDQEFAIITPADPARVP